MKRTADGLIATSIRTTGAFAVYRPHALDDAVRIASESEEPPTVIAGGTDLVAQFNEGLAPHALLALRGVRELDDVAVREGMLHLGALVTHATGSCHELVRRTVPGLASAWARIANVRVRFTATLGGNLLANRTRYEMPILLSALDARVRLRGRGGVDDVPVDRLAQRCTAAREILTAAVVPLADLVAFDYDRSLRPIMTQAVCLRVDAGRLRGRAVLGTEALPPYVLDVDLGGTNLASLGGRADDIARETYRAFPAHVRDHLTGNAYLRRAGTALLARALKRVADGAA